jgi:hypothetical protein
MKPWVGLFQECLAQHRNQQAEDEMALHLYNAEVKGRPIRRGCLFWWVGSRLLPLSQHIWLTKRQLSSSNGSEPRARSGRSSVSNHCSTMITILVLDWVIVNEQWMLLSIHRPLSLSDLSHRIVLQLTIKRPRTNDGALGYTFPSA